MFISFYVHLICVNPFKSIGYTYKRSTYQMRCNGELTSERDCSISKRNEPTMSPTMSPTLSPTLSPVEPPSEVKGTGKGKGKGKGSGKKHRTAIRGL